ncbi:MAG: sugar O-acetyltransferase [Prevotellaceae bacterium]|jgi:acetyltransferase-like isoleucine patch superfamily enzyme|nr:sugar O-acetyltransferase [Prevotellaceae bacterium]
MKTELEKCMNGEWYDCHAQVFVAFKAKTRELLSQYNALPYTDKAARYSLLKEMFGSVGTNVSVGNPFICDYGHNIHIGDNVSVNMNCTFIDCNKITIGNRVLIASNVQIYTAAHPVNLSERLTPEWTVDSEEYFCRTFALPVTIEDDCWIGGGVIIVPGVTIGRGAVVGAGSVVTKDIPKNSLAVGNPCRVIRKLNGEERI